MRRTMSTALLILMGGLATGCAVTKPPHVGEDGWGAWKEEWLKVAGDDIAATLAPIPESAYETPQFSQKLGAGDLIDISVYQEPDWDLSKVEVTQQASQRLGYFGSVPVLGLTPADLEETLQRSASSMLINPKIAVTVSSWASRSFHILGKVRQPGKYPLNNSLRVSEACAIAQGFESGIRNNDAVELADLTSATLVRKGVVIPIDFRRALEGDPDHNIYLHVGDYIHVPERTDDEVIVLGAVKAAEAFPLKDASTLLRSLALAKGLNEHANGKEVVLLRDSETAPRVLIFDAESALIGKIPDVRLKGGDVVYVAEDPISKLELVEWVKDITGAVITLKLASQIISD